MTTKLPLCEPVLDGNESRYLQQCIEDGFVSSVGAFVNRFEDMIAKTTGCAEVVATSSGTTGLHLALVAMGVRAGDLVILPSYTFIASASAISHCGAEPWLMDVEAESWTLDPYVLEQALKTQTERHSEGLVHLPTGRRVTAIMPVYALGLPARMAPLIDIAKTYGLPVVADAAAAIGATYEGSPVGALGADMTVFSFNGNKTVTSGGGGAVVGNDKSLMKLARHLSSTARNGPGYDHDRVGFNYRMTNLEAAVGCAQLERLSDFIKAKYAIAMRYRDGFAGMEGIQSFPAPVWAKGSNWLSGIVVEQADKLKMAHLREHLIESGIDVRPFWKPMHLQAPFVNAPRTDLGVCDAFWYRVLPLPCSSNLAAADQDRVIAIVKQYFAAVND